jgi:hypothetical protein
VPIEGVPRGSDVVWPGLADKEEQSLMVFVDRAVFAGHGIPFCM